MNRSSWIKACAALSLVAGACGSDDNGGGVYTQQELSAALLRVDDLGSGWSEEQRDVFSTREPENPSIDPSLWCPDALEQDTSMQSLAGDAGADAEFQLQQGDSTVRLRQQAWNNTDAAEYFTAATSAIQACDSVTWTAPEGETYSFATVDGPALGDGSASWEITIEMPSPNGDTAVLTRQFTARFGNTMMVMQQGTVRSSDTEDPSTETDWRAIVSTAGARIAALDES